MKSNKLIVGKKYYFDYFEDDNGTLLSNDGITLVFEPIGDTGYNKEPDGTVEFDIKYLKELHCDNWNEVEE